MSLGSSKRRDGGSEHQMMDGEARRGDRETGGDPLKPHRHGNEGPEDPRQEEHGEDDGQRGLDNLIPEDYN